jgi:hypothetical protein
MFSDLLVLTQTTESCLSGTASVTRAIRGRRPLDPKSPPTNSSIKVGVAEVGVRAA